MNVRFETEIPQEHTVMTIEEEQADTRYATDSGSLERIRFPDEDPGERSLLSLIEERRTNGNQGSKTTVVDGGRSSFIDPLDVEEADQPTLDRLMMRLGGNGF